MEGRLNQPLATEKQALLQLHESYKMGWISMSEAALKKVEKYLEEDKQLQAVREKIQAAVDTSTNKVTFEEAKKQVENSKI